MVVRAGPVVLISTIAHGVLVVLVADWTTPPVKRPPLTRPAAASAPRAAPIEAAPIEVAFLVEEAAPAAVGAHTSGRTATRTAASKAASKDTSTTTTIVTSTSTSTGTGTGTGTSTSTDTGTSTGTDPSTGTDTSTSGPGTGLMKMRGADLALDAGTAERIAGSRTSRPSEVKKSGKLQSTPGGGAVVYDRVTTMTVDQDGNAHFDDKPDIDVHFHLPIPKVWEVDRMRKELGHQLTEWFKDPEAGKRFGRTQDLPRHLQAAPGACDSWGSTMCDDPLAPKLESLVRERKKVMGGFFGGMTDITAYLHRKFVGDPYSSRKLKLLADTLDERVAIGTAHRAEQAARSAELMRNNLDRLWSREQQPIARRAALFELWDECGEDEAGLRARAVVIGWIRAKLPAGSADAYTAEELATLQTRRTSSTAFAPYE